MNELLKIGDAKLKLFIFFANKKVKNFHFFESGQLCFLPPAARYHRKFPFSPEALKNVLTGGYLVLCQGACCMLPGFCCLGGCAR
jgi:hypothetical protein